MSKVRLATLLWSNPTFADTLLNSLSTIVIRAELEEMSLVIAVKSTWAKLALAAAFAALTAAAFALTAAFDSAFSAAVFRPRAVLAELAALLSLEDAAFALAAAAKALTAAAFAPCHEKSSHRLVLFANRRRLS